MKTLVCKVFLMFLVTINLLAANSYPAAPGDVQIVVTEKKIWFVAEETPLKKMDIQIVDQNGLVVAQKQLNAKCADWSLDLKTVAAGQYDIYIDQILVKHFEKQAKP